MKQRIKAIIKYKKPAFIVMIMAGIAIVLTVVCFVTNPKEKNSAELQKQAIESHVDVVNEKNKPQNAKQDAKGELYTGYAILCEMNDTVVTLDLVEYINLKDGIRCKELGLTAEDMPKGYYIYNPEEKEERYESTPLAKQQLQNCIDKGEDSIFYIETKGKKLTWITELSEPVVVQTKQYPEEMKLDHPDGNCVYICGMDGDAISVDMAEYITLKDEVRCKDLWLTEDDMTNGYYIFNEAWNPEEYYLTEGTEYSFMDWGREFGGTDEDPFVTTKNRQVFMKYLQTYENATPGMPFFIELDGDKVTRIYEVPMP